MKQHINLLPPRPVEIVDHTKFQTVSLVFGGALSLCLAVTLGLWVYAQGLEDEVTSLKSQSQQYEAQVAQLTTQYASRTVDPALQQEEKRLQERLEDKRALYALLEQIEPQSSAGFAKSLRAIADASVDGVWLAGLEVDGDATEVQIEGYSLSADPIPTFLGALSQQSALSGLRFDELKIERREPEQRYQFSAVGQRPGLFE